MTASLARRVELPSAAHPASVSQGYKNGFTVQWTMAPSKPYKKTTQMQLDSAHLKWAQVLTILTHLKKV